jgi:hypothetical protein
MPHQLIETIHHVAYNCYAIFILLQFTLYCAFPLFTLKCYLRELSLFVCGCDEKIHLEMN